MSKALEVVPANADCAILDCPHVFGASTVVRVNGAWHLCLAGDGGKGKDGQQLTNVISVPANYCHICGRGLDDAAPVRTYVLGANEPLDHHVKACLIGE